MWQVKDFADGWIDVADEASAKKLSARQCDAAIRPKPADYVYRPLIRTPTGKRAGEIGD